LDWLSLKWIDAKPQNTVELFFMSFWHIFRKCAVHCLHWHCSVRSTSVLVCEVECVGDIFYPFRHHVVCYGCSNRVTRWFPDKTFLTAETDFSY
jgi:hypothetical protein